MKERVVLSWNLIRVKETGDGEMMVHPKDTTRVPFPTAPSLPPSLERPNTITVLDLHLVRIEYENGEIF